ncbi:MAG TPA: energy transducer TonB [Candidatus Limnocylindrales bacterium]|nr:energy transducer TonB [Candidatus Limnocylindrales bacterium]
MKATLRLVSLAIGATLLAGTLTMIAPKTAAQDPSTEAAKRKVKTKILPDYPQIARPLNLAGKVKIEVTISADGRVTSTRVVGGSPVFASSAVDAVKRWRFEPAPKDTTEIIEIDFAPPARN